MNKSFQKIRQILIFEELEWQKCLIFINMFHWKLVKKEDFVINVDTSTTNKCKYRKDVCYIILQGGWLSTAWNSDLKPHDVQYQQNKQQINN